MPVSWPYVATSLSWPPSARSDQPNRTSSPAWGKSEPHTQRSTSPRPPSRGLALLNTPQNPLAHRQPTSRTLISVGVPPQPPCFCPQHSHGPRASATSLPAGTSPRHGERLHPRVHRRTHENFA